MIKKFTLLLLAMLCFAGTNAKVQLSLVNLDAGWSATYNTTTKTITFEKGTYYAKGWTYGKSVSSNPYLVVEFANSNDASKVLVSAGGIEPSAETDKSYIICDLSSKGETTISEILIKNKEASAEVTLKDAFLLTASEYADYINIKARKTDLGFTKWIEKWDSESKITNVDTETHSVTFSANSGDAATYGWNIWATPGGRTLVFELDGNQKACKVEVRVGGSAVITKTIKSGDRYVIIDINSYSSSEIQYYLFYNTSTEANTITYRQAYYSNQTVENETKCLTEVKATIGSSGYTAFSCNQALDFTDVEGVTAYIVSSTDTENAIMTPVNKVPANTGLVLAGTANASYWIPITTESTEDVSSNLLLCAIDATNVQASEGSTSRYILAKQNGDTGFYKLEVIGSNLKTGTDDKKYHTLSCNKAYLEVTSVAMSARSFINMSFGGDGNNTTGISNTVSEKSVRDNIYYNLNGTAVNNPSKGLYIINGKKVIIK